LNLGEIKLEGDEESYSRLGEAILSLSCLSELRLSLKSKDISKNIDLLSTLS